MVCAPIFVLLPPPEPVDLLPVDAADDLRLLTVDLLGVVAASAWLFVAGTWFSMLESAN